MTAQIRTLIVDDEAPARHRLTTLLGEEADIEIVGECADGQSAVEHILRLAPDVLFLDVQMPEMSGFEVLDTVSSAAVPAVVFVTAYDEHAMGAFEAGAVDYLLKPFTSARMRETLARVRRMLAGDAARAAQHDLQALLSSVLPPASERRVAVRDGDRICILRSGEIERLEGAGNYVRVHARERTYLIRSTLRLIAERLRGAGFRRISHSTVVNTGRIRALDPLSRGAYRVLLDDGTAVRTSRSYADAVREILQSFTA